MQDETIISDETVLQVFPPLIKRFQSVIIDQVFIIFCMGALSQVLPYANGQNGDVLKGVLLFGLFFIYEPLCMTFGCTVGNLITGIRVRKFNNQQERINIFQSYLRFLVKIFLGWISFLTVTSNTYKRAIHDMAAGSIMVYAVGSKDE